ncbi:MAG: APC family permease [Bacteroidota bacterium]
MSNPTKALGQKDIVLFCVAAILLLDTLAASASIGVSAIFWWLFLGVIFFVPFGLISAELGCAYPEQGGIYVWVKKAFGKRWAARVTWSYWVNITVWAPAIFILFAGIFKQLFWTDLSLQGQVCIGVLLTWLTVLVNCVTLDVGKWVPNIGAVLKMAIFLLLIFGAIQYVGTNGTANEISWKSLRPNLSNSLQYISVIIYGMLGFELVSANSEQMRQPAKDVPRAILISGAIILTLYTAATAAMLVAIPVEDINLVEGLMDTLYLFFGSTGLGGAFALFLGIGALYTFFAGGAVWAIGGNSAMAEAAQQGEFPSIFAKESLIRKTPVGSALLFGLSSTLILVLYGFLAGSNEDLFWSLFAFSGILFFLPYIAMSLAFVQLRRKDANHPRPYQIPGGSSVAIFIGYLCALILTFTMTLFFYTPEDGMQWPVFLGAVALILIGEGLIYVSTKR